MKNTFKFLLLLLFPLLVSCKSFTPPEEKGAAIEQSSDKKSTPQSNQNNDTFQYKYNADRPLWVTIPETGETLSADGNFLTTIAMESVQDTPSRKLLQKKYDEGYSLNLEVKNNQPTGTIFLLHPTKGNTEITVDSKNIDLTKGKKIAEELAESEKPSESKTISDVTAQTPNAQIKTFDEAVNAVCHSLGINKDTHLFYDFGLSNDKGEYYHIEVKEKNSGNVYTVKVYTLDGSVLQEAGQ